MKNPILVRTIKSILLGTALCGVLSQNTQALDNGVDPSNLQKGDWIYVLSTATNKLGGNVTTVTNLASLMSYEKSQGMAYVVVKAGDGSTNFPSSGEQLTTSVVTAAHNAGLQIFGYDRSYGVNIPGEIAIATNAMHIGADGFIVDAEIEWESLANNTTLATNLLQGIKNVFPTRFLGHSPMMYISLHSSFPYKQFGLFCDAVMPQDYWAEFGITPSQSISDLDTEWNNWQNGLTGAWTNAIKPIAPIGQGWSPNPPTVTAADITTFYNGIKNDTTPATAGGYQGISWWRADLHTASQWTAIRTNSIGQDPAAAPVISGVAAGNISGTTATITWATDQSSDSVVEYGKTTSYGTLTTNTAMVVSHSVTISNLSGATVYHYRVKSKNASSVTGVSGDFTFTSGSGVADIIIDNTSAAIVGTWSTGSSATDKFGTDYRFKSGGTGSATATFTPSIVTAGDYNVYEWHSAGANRTVAAPITVTYNGGTANLTINQEASGGQWVLLGTFNFVVGTAGSAKISDNFADSANVVIADAIKFSYLSAGSPPAAPSGLTATAISPTQINLSWTDNSNNENNFIVSRSTTSGGPYTDIATLGANTTAYNDTSVSSSTTYYYVVRASNASGSSALSAQASATTPAGPPAAPSNLAASPLSSSAIKLTWTDNSNNELNFIVARSATSGGPYSDIATLGANITTYTNTGLTAGTTYYYVVRSSNGSGSSLNSSQASASPVADTIIDNPSATVVGTWSTGTSSTDKFGTDYRFIGPGTGANYLQYTPTITSAGNYQVYEWHAQGANRTTAAPIVVNYNGGSVTNTVNQQVNGGTWVLIGTYNFAAGTAGNVKIQDNFSTGSVVIADAIKFVLSN